jgi:hypothetical protein
MILLASIYEIGLWLSYLLLALAFFGMLFGIAVTIFQNMKEGGMIALGGFVGVIVLFFIAYAMSASVVPEDLKQFVGESGYKLSSAGLITFYIMFAIAFLMMILGLVKSIFTGN